MGPGSGPPPSMNLPLPLPLTSKSSFSDRPTPTKAQLTMPPRMNHAKAAGLVFSEENINFGYRQQQQSFLQGNAPRLDLPPEESTDLEELEQFAKLFKQKRIKLGK